VHAVTGNSISIITMLHTEAMYKKIKKTSNKHWIAHELNRFFSNDKMFSD
jgi:hypothetical protein